MVLIGCEQQRARSAEAGKCIEGGGKQKAADPLPTMIRMDDKVIDDARRAAERHIIIPFLPDEGIADDLAVALGNQHPHVGALRLADEEATITFGQIRNRSDETLRIEIMMLGHEQSAEFAESVAVGGDRWPDCRE